MIPHERIEQIAQVVERAGLSETTLAALRQSFTELHFTYCLDDEIGTADPVREGPGFRLYLVDGRSHCMRFTADPEAATGLVLAEVDPDAAVED